MTTTANTAQETVAVANPLATGAVVNEAVTTEQFVATVLGGNLPEGFEVTSAVFNYRTKKVFDEEGNELKDKAFKPDPVKVLAAVPSLSALFSIASADSKVADMLLSLAHGEILGVLRNQANQLVEEGTPVTLDKLDFTKATLENAAIEFASSGRSGVGEAEVDAALAAFAAWAIDSGREQAKVETTVGIIRGKFAKVRTHKPVLGRLAEVFSAWVGSDAAVEETHSKYIKQTASLLTKLLTATEADLSDSIL